MATAYVVEVFIDGVYKYMGASGKLGKFPKFFSTANQAKRFMRLPHMAYGNLKFNLGMKNVTRVIQIAKLENGLNASTAKIMSYDEFMIDFVPQSSTSPSIPNNPKAVYKIKLNPMLQLAKKTSEPVFVNVGSRKEKFGRTWNSASALRGHITGRLFEFKKYEGATVFEIEYADDGVTTKQVKTYPILDFYCASPSSLKQYNQRFPKTPYKPGA